MQTLSKLHSTIEAILFLENAFISNKELSKKAACKEDDVEALVQEINAIYTKYHHAFYIIKESQNYLMVITQDFSQKLAHLYKSTQQQKLSRALLETLSVIAYSQPITKSEINEIRGVNSDGAIKVLIAQNLVKTLGKKPVPGAPNQYGTTGEFLRTFGLHSIKDLPKMKPQDSSKFEISKSVEHAEKDSANNG